MITLDVAPRAILGLEDPASPLTPDAYRALCGCLSALDPGQPVFQRLGTQLDFLPAFGEALLDAWVVGQLESDALEVGVAEVVRDAWDTLGKIEAWLPRAVQIAVMTRAVLESLPATLPPRDAAAFQAAEERRREIEAWEEQDRLQQAIEREAEARRLRAADAAYDEAGVTAGHLASRVLNLLLADASLAEDLEESIAALEGRLAGQAVAR